MVWGCIWGDRQLALIIWDPAWGKITGPSYVEHILEPHFYPIWRSESQATGNYVYFQQDNAAPHRAKFTQNALQNAPVGNIHDFLFPWPADSPDASPIENVWQLMKSRIQGRSPRPTRKADLIAAIYEEWNALTSEDIWSFTGSLPDRPAAIKAASGGHFPY
jgi:hypothetical protein